MRNRATVLLICFLLASLARGEDLSFAIKMGSTSPVEYCNDPVLILNNLEITGSPNISGFKISFSEGYHSGEDELTYTGSLNSAFNTLTGSLTLTGGSNAADYVNAIRQIKYRNKSTIPTLGIRKITISLSDIDYLPQTGHFYRYIDKVGTSWNSAKAEAESAAMIYYGLKGYLATITSAAENDFIKLKTKGVGWIGATDVAQEGEWRWVTGPEGLEDLGKGRLFWRGTGYQAKLYPTMYGAVNAEYHNWNKWDVAYPSTTPTDTWEPNQSGDEDYGHITYFNKWPNDSYKWNDLPNVGGNGDYAPQGYLIEYGGYAGETVPDLTGTVELQVNTVIFSSDLESTICEGDIVELNQPDTYSIIATYLWSPAESLSDASVANPIAGPIKTTTYNVKGTRQSCSSSASFVVEVNPKPVSTLQADYPICQGEVIILDPGESSDYLWGTGETTRTYATKNGGNYTVKLTTDKNCSATFASKVTMYEYPSISLISSDLICGKKQSVVTIATSSSDGYRLSPADMASGMIIVDNSVTVPDFGDYKMVCTTNDQYCSSSKEFPLSFYKIPDGTINVIGQLEGQKCYGYNLDVKFNSPDDHSVSDFEWRFGGEIISQGIGLDQLTVPLGENKEARNLSLTVNDKGCSATFEKNNILVIPKLSFSYDLASGCGPLTVNFKAINTENVKYYWDFYDPESFEEVGDQDRSHIYKNAGTYDVRVKVISDEGCINEVKKTEMIQVYPIPDVAFSISPDECLDPGDHEVRYAGLIGNQADQYIWILSDLDPSEIITNPGEGSGPLVFNLKTKPSATIGLSVKSYFSCESNTNTLLIKRKPDFSIEASSKIGCTPFAPTLSGVVHFDDKVDDVDYSWDFGDGETDTGSTVSHLYTQPDQSYGITLNGKSKVTQCENSLAIPDFLETYPKPVASFDIENEVIYNDQPTANFLNRSSGAQTYYWQFGDGLTSELTDPSHFYSVTGYQTVLLKAINQFSCSDTISHPLLIAFSCIFPPTGFSPKSPNAVDREFKLWAAGIVETGYHLTVLSRWDDVVFETKDQIVGWDGRMKNGDFAPAGVYVWKLSYFDFLGRPHQQAGSVTLVY